jgi:hypothetical protein
MFLIVFITEVPNLDSALISGSYTDICIVACWEKLNCLMV